MYDQYKAHREGRRRIGPAWLIRVATKAFSIPCIKEDGLDGTRPHRLSYVDRGEGGRLAGKVTIVSSDKAIRCS